LDLRRNDVAQTEFRMPEIQEDNPVFVKPVHEPIDFIGGRNLGDMRVCSQAFSFHEFFDNIGTIHNEEHRHQQDSHDSSGLRDRSDPVFGQFLLLSDGRS